MVKDWDPEGFNLLTSQKPTALEEDRGPALSQGTRTEGGKQTKVSRLP